MGDLLDFPRRHDADETAEIIAEARRMTETIATQRARGIEPDVKAEIEFAALNVRSRRRPPGAVSPTAAAVSRVPGAFDPGPTAPGFDRPGPAPEDLGDAAAAIAEEIRRQQRERDATLAAQAELAAHRAMALATLAEFPPTPADPVEPGDRKPASQMSGIELFGRGGGSAPVGEGGGNTAGLEPGSSSPSLPTQTSQVHSPRQRPREITPSRADDLFWLYRKNLAPREGKFADRKTGDLGGPTMKGISQKLLNRLLKQPQWSHLPAQTKNLTDPQIEKILRIEFFDRPQIARLEQVPGLAKAAPLLPEQVFDAGVLHGPEITGRWLQQSLDEALGTDLRTRNAETGILEYDGVTGSRTRRAVEQAVRQGKIVEVNNRIVDKRVALMKAHPDFKHNPGWIPRAESFRIRVSTP